MRKSSIINHPSSIPRGFTIIECLIGLAVSAILLTAVAAAFNAAAINYRENEEMFRSVNNARQALTRMTSQLRVAGYQHPTLGRLSVPYSLGSSDYCTFWTSEGENLTYVFRSADHKLYLRKEATGEEYELCDDVLAASFSKIPTDNGEDCKAVQISLTVQSGRSVRSLAAAAVVRRNL